MLQVLHTSGMLLIWFGHDQSLDSCVLWIVMFSPLPSVSMCNVTGLWVNAFLIRLSFSIFISIFQWHSTMLKEAESGKLVVSDYSWPWQIPVCRQAWDKQVWYFSAVFLVIRSISGKKGFLTFFQKKSKIREYFGWILSLIEHDIILDLWPWKWN